MICYIKYLTLSSFVAHNMARILDKINESGMRHQTFNVDSLLTTGDIVDVLDLIHNQATEGMVNITIVCHLTCTRRILKEVPIHYSFQIVVNVALNCNIQCN